MCYRWFVGVVKYNMHRWWWKKWESLKIEDKTFIFSTLCHHHHQRQSQKKNIVRGRHYKTKWVRERGPSCKIIIHVVKNWYGSGGDDSVIWCWWKHGECSNISENVLFDHSYTIWNVGLVGRCRVAFLQKLLFWLIYPIQKTNWCCFYFSR